MLMIDETTYPGIYRAALAIAIDNGGINRWRSKENMQGEYSTWLRQQHQQNAEFLKAASDWLAALSEEDLETVACGEHTEAEALLKNAPAKTGDLLNSYFDEVC